MPDQGLAGKHSIAGMIFVLMMLSLTGCKKETSNTEAGDMYPASALSTPAEVSADDTLPTQPLGNMKGLSVKAPPAQSVATELPTMKPVTGMDLSVRLSQRMMTTPGWTQNFAAVYKPVSDCIESTQDAASVMNVEARGSSELSITLEGLDGQWQTCLIEATGGPVKSLQPLSQIVKSTAEFFPRSAGKPVVDEADCKIIEPVVARPGGLIGWMSFEKPDCG